MIQGPAGFEEMGEDEDFAKLLEESFRNEKSEKIIEGAIVEIKDDYVAVDIGKIDAFPLAVQIFGTEGGIAAGVVTAFGNLDLDDVCAHVSQHHGAEGADKHTGQGGNGQLLLAAFQNSCTGIPQCPANGYVLILHGFVCNV